MGRKYYMRCKLMKKEKIIDRYNFSSKIIHKEIS